MRKVLLTSLALAVAATPALAHRDAGPAPHHGPKHPKKERPAKAKGPKGTLHLLHACVVEGIAGATADPPPETGDLKLHVLQGNRHMKRYIARELAGSDEYTAALDGGTRIRLVGRARHLPEGSTPKRKPRLGTFADLTPGDQVMVRFRATRDAADLGPAFSVIDRGQTRKCAEFQVAPPEPTPTDPPVEDPAPAL
jgi:hypothetical protein